MSSTFDTVANIISETCDIEREKITPESHAIDDLYWCFRRLQAYESWQSHGAWISEKDRGLGPGVKERFAFGATIEIETVAAETERRDTQAYRERALRLLCLSGLSGFPQISLPLGSVEDAPFGISLLGPPGSDLALIDLGRRILESAGRASAAWRS